MEILTSTGALPAFIYPVVAIGNFDGVHVGHRELLRRARSAARAHDGEAIALTFDPHPAKVLAPKLAPPLILTPARKLELLAENRIDFALVLPFSLEFAKQTPRGFIEEVLARRLGVRELVIGHDFTFGANRAGTIATLEAGGAQFGFTVHVVSPIDVQGMVASSTKIRELVLEGNLPGARMLLGRNFEMDGIVIRGAGRGRSIGIPTANIACENELLPRPGVYAARATVLDEELPISDAVVNLGTNPTFVKDGRLSLEAHLLDVDRDLYDRRVRIEFVSWLRGEERFPSATALADQIHKDIEAARTRLGER